MIKVEVQRIERSVSEAKSLSQIESRVVKRLKNQEPAVQQTKQELNTILANYPILTKSASGGVRMGSSTISLGMGRGHSTQRY